MTQAQALDTELSTRQRPLSLDELVALVTDEVATRLGVDPETVDRHAPLDQEGVSSIDAIDITQSLDEILDIELSDAAVLPDLSIVEVAERLVALGATAEAAPADAPPHGRFPEGRDTDPSGPAAADTRERLVHRLTTLAAPAAAAIAAGAYNYHPEIERHATGAPWVKGREMLDASSFDYQAFTSDPRITAAAAAALEECGFGGHGSRLLAGTTPQHVALEAELAAFVGHPSAVLFPTGWQANVSAIATLFGPGDVVITDEYVHDSIAKGAAYSRAWRMHYRHNDMPDLRDRLEMARGRIGQEGVIVVVADAVYSMEGTILPLPDVVDLCRRYGASLMVDEAHSFGILGSTGHGIAEHFGMPAADVDITIATLSKSVPINGGWITGSPALQQLDPALRHNASGYVFSAAPPAAQIATALACLRTLAAEPDRPRRLAEAGQRVRDGLREAGLTVLGDPSVPLVPVVCPDDLQAAALAAACQQDGLLVQDARWPAVPRESPRLRIVVTLHHTAEDLERIVATVADNARKLGVVR